MLSHRVIPALLLQGGALVKTTKFRNARYVGDPINAIRIFNEKEVDELAVLDIGASVKGCPPDFELIAKLAGECFIPLAYGGGIRSLDDAKKIFSLGVEKICLRTAALARPRLITEIAGHFGSQSVVVSLDVKRDWLGRPRIYQGNGLLGQDPWLEVLQAMVSAGAGEVLLNAVDRDGTLAGPDLALIQQASISIQVPLIAIGGISSLADMRACVDSGASAVAAGAFFVFHGPHRAVLLTYPKPEELVKTFHGP
jgi:cyclase